MDGADRERTDRSGADRTRTDRRSVLRTGAGAGATALAAGVAGCAGRDRERSRTASREVPVGDADAVEIRVPQGDVTVTGADGDTGDAEDGDGAVLGATVRRIDRGGPADRVVDFLRTLLSPLLGDDGTLETTRSEGVLTLRVPEDDPAAALGVELSVTVPEGVAVRSVGTGEGAVEVRGVAGDPSVATGRGSVRVEDVDGYPAVEVGTGDVLVEDPAGVGDVGVVAGDVDVEVPAVRGETRVETGQGDVTAELAGDLGAVVEASAETVTVEEGLFDEVAVDDPGRVRGRVGGAGNRELEFVADGGAVRLTRLRGES